MIITILLNLLIDRLRLQGLISVSPFDFGK